MYMSQIVNQDPRLIYKNNINNFLAPPAERQRSFSNADSSVVRRRPSSSTFHLKYYINFSKTA